MLGQFCFFAYFCYLSDDFHVGPNNDVLSTLLDVVSSAICCHLQHVSLKPVEDAFYRPLVLCFLSDVICFFLT